MPDDETPTLWLRDAAELENPQFMRILLWPAREVSAIVYDTTPASGHLNPFERALVDIAAAGIRKPEEQAHLLGISVQFVHAMQSKLASEKILDHRGAPTPDDSAPSRPRVFSAVRLYVDPWEGVLWPRYATKDELVEVEPVRPAGHLHLKAGSEGDPRLIPAVGVQPPSDRQLTVTADEAIAAVRSWSRRASQRKGGRVPSRIGVRVLHDGARDVRLAAPLTGGGRMITDPFGGPLWDCHKRRAESFGFGLTVASTTSIELGERLTGVAGVLGSPDAGRLDRAARLQVRAELDALADEALDRLQHAARMEAHVVAELGPERWSALLGIAGIELDVKALGSGVRAALTSRPASLHDRLLAEALIEAAREPAQICEALRSNPQILLVLVERRGRSNMSVTELRRLTDVVRLLVDAASGMGVEAPLAEGAPHG